jgi:hypothetical protein
MKKPYEKPELEITIFKVEDITCYGESVMEQEGADWLYFNQ